MPISLATSLVTFTLTFIGVVSFAVTAFGGDIIFQLGWQLCSIASPTICSGHLLVTLGMMSLLGFIKLPIQLIVLRANVNVKLGIRLATFQCIGAVLGLYILTTVGSDLLFKRLFGLFLFALGVWYLRREVEVNYRASAQPSVAPGYEATADFPTDEEMKGVLTGTPISEERLKPFEIDDMKKTDPNYSMDPGDDVALNSRSPADSNKQLDDNPLPRNNQLKIETMGMEIYVACFGLVSGVLGGIYGTGGPPLMVFANSTGINKDEWRATAAFCYFFENMIRAYYILYIKKVINFNDERFLFMGLVFSVVSGLIVGNSLAGNVSTTLWRQIILMLLMSGSAAMMSAGAPDKAALAVFMMVAFTFVLLFIAFRRSYDVALYYVVKNAVGRENVMNFRL